MMALRPLSPTVLFYSFCSSVIALFCIGLLIDMPILAALPLGLLVVLWGIADYKSLFYLLLFSLPLSIEYYFSSSLATDLPTEPLMIGLMGITLLLLFSKSEKFPIKALKFKPLLWILFHLFWILICAINSENFVYSIKGVFVKNMVLFTILYIAVFIIKTEEDLRKIFWTIFIPLTLAIVVTMLRHGIIYHFAFEDINRSVGPYFRNHVNYAAMVSIFFPWLWMGRKWYPTNSFKYKLVSASILLYVVAIYFSFTRTCMLALLAMIPFYFVLRWNVLRPILISVVVVIIIGITFLITDNYYMRFAPDFAKTVYHDDFGAHLTSTFEGEDVSSMERVYRWVAAIQMVSDRPWMGVGSGNFYDYYKKYALSAFETYISENEERSTVHNYFLLILVEQGAIGLFIFVMLTIFIFWEGNKLYQRVPKEQKWFVMILMQCMLSLYVNLLLSDMLESDKVGPFFYLTVALLAMISIRSIEFKKSNATIKADGHQ
jgi:O-antigen ligase